MVQVEPDAAVIPAPCCGSATIELRTTRELSLVTRSDPPEVAVLPTMVQCSTVTLAPNPTWAAAPLVAALPVKIDAVIVCPTPPW